MVRVAYDLRQRGVAACALHRRETLADREFPGHRHNSFLFLDRVTTQDGLFAPVGNQGWYAHGEDKALYDQQPIEAATTAEAALAAYELLGDEQFLATFHRARDWFFGQNSLRQPLVDACGCSCFDGLSASGVNRNRGAESTLAYLWGVTTELRTPPLDRAQGELRKAKRRGRGPTSCVVPT